MSPDVTPLRIGPGVAGPGAPLFVVAEIGLNHDGSIDRALAWSMPPRRPAPRR